MTKVVVVNEKDEKIGLEERSELSNDAIVRISGLWLENSAGEVLLAQRSMQKIYDTGKWGMAVCGTVEEGEDYLSNILKETEEEIGLKINASDLRVEEKMFIDIDTEHKFFFQIYSACMDIPISTLRLQTEEVETVRFMTKEKLWEEFQAQPENFAKSFGLHRYRFDRV